MYFNKIKKGNSNEEIQFHTIQNNLDATLMTNKMQLLEKTNYFT